MTNALSQKVAAVLEGYVKDGRLPGAVALVAQGGQELCFHAAGLAEREAGVPMARDTLFRIASMTKPITSAAAFCLIEDGVLALDAPISRWLPEFAAPRVLATPGAPLSDTVPARRPITVRDLLSHRAGLAYPITAEGELQAALSRLGDAFFPSLAPDVWLQRLGALPLAYQPGERWNYGYATDVLGMLVARAAGQSFPDFLSERFFQPLGMVDTAFDVPPQKQGRFAAAYVRDPATQALTCFDPPAGRWSQPPVFPSGGAGLVSTIDDYMAFARMILGEGAYQGRRFLSRASVVQMWENVLTPEERAMTFIGQEGFWAASGFGLGLSPVMNPEHHPANASLHQSGWPGAFGTFWFADFSKDVAAILMIQEYLCALPIAVDFQRAIYEGLAI